MISLGSWNIRGMNLTPKQDEVREVMTSNTSCCRSGTRIIIDWDPCVVQLMVISMSDQVVHCLVHSANNDCKFYISFVCANNAYIIRRVLWNDLEKHKNCIGAFLWVIMGDFNVSLDVEESSAESSRCTLAMREFRDCVDSINIVDINHSGFQFTWNQRPNSNTGILKKIDRVMANDHFISNFTNSYVIFHPYGISDHCPTHDVSSHNMYLVVKKLQMLKKTIRKLMWHRGDIHKKEIKSAIFSIGNNKSPGLDGYTSCFFKESWDIVSCNIVKAVKDLFINESLVDVVSLNQSAFIPGRRIADNIMLTQEIMRNYHIDRGTLRCAIKVDIQKAYDTVDWNFLEASLICFGHLMKMVR
ncbi:uncharacterized protein [Rutidosis leptorrhynchoides]|uniref:uncharacterized protein n=1 Tax=Rutidosis leptorrhynchoides TaxID=125765 RepID=UPI003A9A0241